MKKFMLIICCLFTYSTFAQSIIAEDSLHKNLTATRSTSIGGYGEVKVNFDLRSRTGTANLTRNVLFVGHHFNQKNSMFSELEVEDAKVVGGTPSGEVALEQLYLKFNFNPNNSVVAGLFIPRIGIINENHLPTTFNGNDRPFVETAIIPSTWREIGIGFYGASPKLKGLNYSVALVNGLNCANFEFGSGIREGRFEGINATASNIAVTGALQYFINHFKFQISTYYGGSNGVNQRTADSLQLNYGAFGTPVNVNEMDVQYNTPVVQIKALGTFVSIPDAERINRAFASNTPESMMGAYIEAGVNILKLMKKTTDKKLTVFARYEMADLNYAVPANGLSDDFQKKQFVVAGLTYQPTGGVAIKIDYVYRKTGEYNKALYVANPYATVLPFYTTNSFVNMGVAYSF